MTQISEFDIEAVKIVPIDSKNQKLPPLRLIQSNGEDPLDTQSYYDKLMNSNLSQPGAIYIIKYKSEKIGFFSITSAAVNSTLSSSLHDLLKDETAPVSALLISKIGIDQSYRCFGLGKYILQYCIGLAKSRKMKNNYSIVLLKTTISLAQKIYSPKYNFKIIQIDNDLAWIYKKI